MSLEWEEIVVVAADPKEVARWWRDDLGWVAVHEEEEAERVFEIRQTPDRLPSILFVGVEEPKMVKNPLHFDLRPDGQEAEVERLLAWAQPGSTSAGATLRTGSCWPTPRATSSASSAPVTS